MQVLPDEARDRGITDELCFAPGREAAGRLFREYLAELGEDLTFQGVQRELEEIPGIYGPPLGALFIAWRGEEAVGCGAIKPLPKETVCELKRLYVRPGERGQGTARAMAELLIDAARNLGYATMKLDTLDRLTAANQLYTTLGFNPIESYNGNPLPGVRFFEKDLFAI